MARIHILAMDANRSGGAGVYTRDLARYLSREHDISVICHEASPELDGFCTVYRILRRNFADWPILWRASAALQLRSYSVAMNALPLAAPDLVIGSAQLLTWAHARRFIHTPLVYLPHSLIAPEEVRTYPSTSTVARMIMTRLFDYLECWALNRAVRTVRFTHTACRAITEYYGSRVTPRFAVFPVAIDLPWAPIKQRSRTPRLLYVGRLVSTKNVSFLIRSLTGLRNLEWSLDIVGDGPEREALVADVRAHGLQDRVTFYGHQESVGRFYTSADLLLFPSRLESSGLVLLEAMSHATPTLSIRADGFRFRNSNHEMVTAGTDGFIADDEAHFFVELAALIQTPAKLVDAGARARAVIARRHGWGSHLAAYDRLFIEALRAAR